MKLPNHPPALDAAKTCSLPSGLHLRGTSDAAIDMQLYIPSQRLMKFVAIFMLLTCLSVPAWKVEAQFIEVTAQIQSIRWLASKTISGVSTVKCVFGKDSWQI